MGRGTQDSARPYRKVGVRALILGLLVALASLVRLPGAEAQGPVSAARPGPMVMQVGGGQLIRLSRTATKVFISEPEIADVQLASDKAVFVMARKPGRTTFIALDGQDEVLMERDVRVVHGTKELEEQLLHQFPAYRISIDSIPGRLILSGAVGTAQDADLIVSMVKGLLGEKDELVNHLKVSAPTQVNLRVRVAEIKRTVNQEFGINWNNFINPGDYTFRIFNGRDFVTQNVQTAAGIADRYILSPTGAGSMAGAYRSPNGRYDLHTMVDALDREGLARTLAEPNLTAASGQTASFLVGGELPIPVASDNSSGTTTIRIEFKQVGVLLSFVPTILAPDRISLRVRPEVSEVDASRSLTVGGTTIPGFNVRRVETTVELGSGQSFALGGLISHSSTDQISKFPGLGDLPILGSLFTSTAFRNDESEMVVVVTPYLVTPTGAEPLPTPLDALRPASDLERLLFRRLLKEDRPTGRPGVVPPMGGRLRGDAGFIY